jgi:serine/threonine protein kinase
MSSSSEDWTLVPFEKLGFTLHEILRSFDHDDNVVLGKGASGQVYLCKLDDGTVVAIKRLREDRAQKKHHHHHWDHGFRAEVETLGRVRHANVVKLICYCTNSRTGTSLLVYEYMANGSLGDALFRGSGVKGENKPHLGWELRLRIALGSARGLAYLHHDCVPPIVHRDVKSNNILLDVRFDAHIADFGLAKSLPDDLAADIKRIQNSGVVGSVGYMAPGSYSLLTFLLMVFVFFFPK